MVLLFEHGHFFPMLKIPDIVLLNRLEICENFSYRTDLFNRMIATGLTARISLMFKQSWYFWTKVLPANLSLP